MRNWMKFRELRYKTGGFYDIGKPLLAYQDFLTINIKAGIKCPLSCCIP